MSEHGTGEQGQERSIGKRANELHATIRYTMWSVFRLARPLAEEQPTTVADEVKGLLDELAGKDVVVRGTYDVSGLRADADLMVWWHSSTPWPDGWWRPPSSGIPAGAPVLRTV